MTLSEEQFRLLSEATLRKTAARGLEHARANLPYLQKTIRDLQAELAPAPRRPALVISAGPSLHKRNSIGKIKDRGFEGPIVCADGALGHCLRNGLIPEYVLTVDPDPHRIIRWFGDPRLTERPADDYFRRQDLDPALHKDEERKNEEMIALVNRYASQIKLIIATSSSPEIAQRCRAAGMELYWWNPLYDDYDRPDSVSRTVFRLNKVPCMVTGGNVGTSAWVFAQSILRSAAVAVVGMDCSYPPGTKPENTQYYEHLKEIFPDDPARGLVNIYNPHLQETWLTDPGYYWYAQIFLKLVQMAPAPTFNCTEGGILFGPGIEFRPLVEILSLFHDGRDYSAATRTT